jgi:hypothetical protein
MKAAATLLLALLAVVSSELYTATPHGWVLSHCVHNVPSGTHLEKMPTREILATYPDGSQHVLPLCKSAEGLPTFHTKKSAMPGGPEVYDGWLAYTEYDVFSPTTNTTFDQFTGYMSTPDTPARAPQVLYIFPGLQNINWVPVVDPDPSVPFDIIQPVLQYPGDRGLYWSVKSWYVTLDVGTVASNEVALNVGDSIFGVMNRTTPTGDTWLINSIQVSTGKQTSITVSHSRLQYQPWAYTTIECYGCNGCSTYPTQPEHFTKLAIYQGKNLMTPVWAVNPQPSKNMQCAEKPVVMDPATIDMDFQPTA